MMNGRHRLFPEVYVIIPLWPFVLEREGEAAHVVCALSSFRFRFLTSIQMADTSRLLLISFLGSFNIQKQPSHFFASSDSASSV